MTTEKWRPFRPANAPDWDHSYGDPPSIRHDCFSVERLFVVPWGSGEGEVGRKEGEPRIQFPSIGYGRSGTISIWDRPRNRTLVYDQSGKCVTVIKNATTYPGYDWDIYDTKGLEENLGRLKFMDALDLGKQVQLEVGRALFISLGEGRMTVADYEAQKVLCRQYLPPQIDAAVADRGDWGDGYIQPVLYPEGYVLYPRFLAEGLEILRFSIR